MINEIVQDIAIPPAPPTGLYDADFQAKVVALLAWFNDHAVEETTLIEKLNVFLNEVNGAIPLINNGLPVADYLGNENQTFLVKAATQPKEAVNLEQFGSLVMSYLDFTGAPTLLDETTTPKLSEVGIIGLNPIAYLYPDGSIIGESDNGKFVKYTNGELVCRVHWTGAATTDLTVNTPMSFFGAVPTISFVAIDGTRYRPRLGSLTTFNLTAEYTFTEVHIEGRGRWK